MPLSCDPEATFDFTLKCDEAKPATSRPAIVCRFLSSRKLREQIRLADQAYDEKDDEAAYTLLVRSILVSAIAWRNIPGEFGEPGLREVMTDGELWEIARGIPAAARLAECEKKASSSSSPAAGAASAASAKDAEGANVPMSPPKTNPSSSTAADAMPPADATSAASPAAPSN